MLGYFGPGTGLELLPQFFALLAFAGMAVLGVLLWPVTTLWRYLRRGKQQPAVQAPADAATMFQATNGQQTEICTDAAVTGLQCAGTPKETA
jgi:hypothetical protein